MKGIVVPEIGPRSFRTFEKQASALKTNWICHWRFQTQIYLALKMAIGRLTPTGFPFSTTFTLIAKIIAGNEGVQILPQFLQPAQI